MSRRTHVIALLCVTIGLASTASAQDDSRQIRFHIAGGADASQWQGFIERLTPDSLYLHVHRTETIAPFSRTAILSLERERLSHPARAAGIGCLAVGGPLGALGYFGTHDPDSPGIEKAVGVISFAVGCAAGALGGFIISNVRAYGWEPWTLPDSIPQR